MGLLTAYLLVVLMCCISQTPLILSLAIRILGHPNFVVKVKINHGELPWVGV
jgi:hypothetical protein